MPKYLDEPPYDSYRMPSCETTKMTNSKVLSNMSDMMVQIIKMMQEIFEELSSKKGDMFGTHNLDQENPCIIDDHNENYCEIQPEFVTKDYVKEFNIGQVVFDPTDIATDITIKVEVIDELTIIMDLKPIVNGSVEKPINLLAIAEKVSVKEDGEFYSFSFDNGSKA
ncbi:hypothetical protein J1N35_005148 [Gossypium stocksii]|uniref:Uncharacterized protein n=1 Tax=Gossypium stocksii TaxID=47602 RepID=A0A9D3WEU6_9ROSI|nr:hypothetical protein J1N35_005148 [Gossypium stocksii]